MPDWTYQTVFRPTFFCLKPVVARSLAFGAMGILARLPWGRRVIQFMGHMKPDPRLAVERRGLRFPAQVGLSCALDPDLRALPAFAEFGFGFLEIGPVTSGDSIPTGEVRLEASRTTLRVQGPQAAVGVQVACERLRRDGPFHVPVLARVQLRNAEDAASIYQGLSQYVDAFVVPVSQLSYWRAMRDTVLDADKPVLLAVDASLWRDESSRLQCEQAISNAEALGVVVGESLDEDGSCRFGPDGRENGLSVVREIRTGLGGDAIVIGSTGVQTPADALDFVEAGADLVQVDSGLVFSGPGLPKRINAALLYRRLSQEFADPPSQRAGTESWFWSLLMGLSMFLGGLLAMIVATTRVVLPYDESMAGLTREQLAAINDRLLSFMTHDRVTLAGTMLAVGIQYVALSWWGIRRGVHWAFVSVVVSALAGFFLFFSFLGFGYFDPFHAFVTAILFQFLLLTIHSRLPPRHRMEMPDLHNDARWKAGQWSQLLFVVHGAILIVAGTVISIVGMTTVFVPEDLEFMRTSAAELHGAHPQLVPLVAHDRATFGGMLIACGVATLLPAMWGFARGQAWLWWALMLAGSVAYLATLLVHWTVGYHSLKHLIPAYGGLAWLWIGSILSYHFLVARNPALEAEWKTRLQPTSSPVGGNR